jgi:hypothetical protein
MEQKKRKKKKKAQVWLKSSPFPYLFFPLAPGCRGLSAIKIPQIVKHHHLSLPTTNPPL